jgi:exonuclease VII small subunit
MFFTSATRSALEARIRELETRLHDTEKEVVRLEADLKMLEPGELLRLRQTVLNALRSLRRLDRSEEAPPAAPEGPLTLQEARRRTTNPIHRSGS